MEKKNYNLYIECMRIILTIYIILMHGEYLFRNISAGRIYEGGYLGVEFFFIVSGYYIAYKSENGINIKDYIKSRFIILYPHYVTSLFCCFFAKLILNFNNIGIKLKDLFWSLLMIQNFGLDIELYNGILWYVTYLFLVGTLIYFILTKTKREKVYTLIFIIIILVFYFLYFYYYKTIDNVSQVIIIFPLGFYRALSDMLMGVLLFKANSKLQYAGNNILLTIIIIVLSSVALYISFCKPHSYYDLLVVLCFLACIFLSNMIEFDSVKYFSQI